MRRSRWQTAAGIFAGLVAAGALVAALSLLTAMQHLLDRGLEALGGDIILTLPGNRAQVERWMERGSTEEPAPAVIDVADWRKRLKDRKVLGLLTTQGISLEQGGAGENSFPQASLLVLRLEFWAAPMMTSIEIREAIPEAEIIVGEQTTRHVLTDLKPLVQHLSTAAGIALLAAALITGLLASIRVGQRRAELGMLRAVGASRSFMIGLTLGESLALGLVGSLLGVVVALGSLALLPFAGGLMAYLSPLDWLRLGGLGVGATTLTSLVATLGPALRTARLDPLDAVRRH